MNTSGTVVGATIGATSVQTTLTVTGTNWTTTRAVGIAYADINGVWRLKFNIIGAISSVSQSSQIISIANTVFKNVSGAIQIVTAGGVPAVSMLLAYAAPNTGNIEMYHVGDTMTAYVISGDVELNAKPSWA